MRRWYQRLSPPGKLLVQALLLVLALGLPTLLLLYPKVRQVSTLRPQVAQLSGKIEAGLRRVTGFSSLTEAEREAWAASRAQLLAKLPPDDELPKLVEELTFLAARSRAVDFLITTSPRVSLKGEAKSQIVGEASLVKAQADLEVNLGYYPIHISFRSSYRDLARFLEGVQGLSPLVTVASMDVRRGDPLLGVRMVLRAYHSGSERYGPR
ncbi:MAG: hypothetical protein ACE5I9_05855 [Candidatus Methylomirabilales bacterium]